MSTTLIESVPNKGVAQNATLFCAFITPFGPRGDLDLAPIPGLLAYLRACGLSGVLVGGTTGEGQSLSLAERRALLEAVIGAADGLQVLACTGVPNWDDTVALTHHAYAAGAVGALVQPPYYYKVVTDAGVANWFRRILDEAELPVHLYHIPQVTGVPITDGVLNALRGHQRLAGMKDSEGSIQATLGRITSYPELAIYVGSDETAPAAVAAGGAGAITGASNAFGAHLRAALDGDGGERAKALAELAEVRTILHRFGLIPSVKALLRAQKFGALHVRPPLMDLAPNVVSVLQGELRAAGL